MIVGTCEYCTKASTCTSTIGNLFGWCRYDFEPKKMTFDRLAAIVADDFCETMRENGWTRFDEMKRCYWWTNKDIKDNVEAIMLLYGENDLHGTSGEYWVSDDGTFVYCNGEEMSYQKFAAMFHSRIRAKTKFWV